uniref:Reverse transcriptase zinc-binding domain-containing protein n=1 Tax=Davidia involucrata TaxID=16924 RepID=A0A5B7BMK3_DAVIN
MSGKCLVRHGHATALGVSVLSKWLVAWDTVTTTDNLQRRGFMLVGRCYMCKKSLESTSHLFLHCEVARDLWNAILSLAGYNWVMPYTIKNLLQSWNEGKMSG